MMKERDPVLLSFARARRHGLGRRFYAILLASSEEIAARFAHTDLDRQVQLFEHGISMLLQFSRGDAVGQMAIERLGRMHSRTDLDIPPDFYATWIGCLIHVLAEVDPEFDDPLQERWIEMIRPGLQHIMAMY